MFVISEIYGHEKLLHTFDGLFLARCASSPVSELCEGRGGIKLCPPWQTGRRLKHPGDSLGKECWTRSSTGNVYSGPALQRGIWLSL